MAGPELITPQLLREWPLPEPTGTKLSRGQVLVVGGAAATPGAVALAGLASLRVGAGRVQLAVARSVAPAMAATFPEAAVLALPETEGGAIRGTAAARLLAAALPAADAVLIGPGLDDIEETVALLAELLPHVEADTALALDAYALGALSESDALAGHLTARAAPAVLTPNEQELGILAGHDEPDEEDVPAVARRYSACVSSLSTVACPDGRTWRVPLGHPGLATAGSGDVMAGLVVGLLARGASAEQAANWGTYLHSAAGERLSSAVGGVGFLARELVDQVPPVLAELG